MTNRRLSPVRKAQKYALDASAAAANAAAALPKKTAEHLRRMDEEHGVSDRIRDTGTRLREAGSQIDDKYGVSETSSKVTSAVSTAANEPAGDRTQDLSLPAERLAYRTR